MSNNKTKPSVDRFYMDNYHAFYLVTVGDVQYLVVGGSDDSSPTVVKHEPKESHEPQSLSD